MRKDTRSIAASLLNLDEGKVEALSLANARTNYGVVVVAGHPIRDAAGDLISSWERELKAITSGRVRLDIDSCHSSIATICCSQSRRVTASDIADVKFDDLLIAIEKCRPYQMEFRELKLSEKQDGNIVLTTHVQGGELGHLQRALKEAGLSVDQDREESCKEGRAYVTLSHLSCDVLAALTKDEVGKLKDWIKAHSHIDRRVVYVVEELRVAMYFDRRLRQMMADDRAFVLGQKAATTGDEIRGAILNAFEPKKITAETLIEAITYAIRTQADRPTKPSKAVRYWDMKTPYGVHPLWCAATLLQETNLHQEDRAEFAIALLYHDLLEDTDVKLEQLPKDIGRRGKWLVEQMTFTGGFDEEMRDVWNRGPEIRLLKLFDKVSNLLDGKWMDDAKWKTYCLFTRSLADDVESNFGSLNILRIARAIAQP